MGIPIVIYQGAPGRSSICRWITNRVLTRRNSCNVRFVGETGSGKSWSALALGEECCRLMNRKMSGKDIYFSVLDMVKEIRDNNPPPGTIFFLDEQQVAASNKEHGSKRNKAYATIMSTVRSKRYIFITTLPFSDMTDKQVRRLFHLEIETKGANLANNTVRSLPRFLNYLRNNDKLYYRKLLVRWRGENGRSKTIKLSTWNIPKPSDDLIQVYEMKKEIFQKKLYNLLADELSKIEVSDNKKEEEPMTKMEASVSVLDTLTPFQKVLFEEMNKVGTRKELLERLQKRGEVEGWKCDQTKIYQNLGWMKSKGVMVMQFKKPDREKKDEVLKENNPEASPEETK